jgi:hypothetical protein
MHVYELARELGIPGARRRVRLCTSPVPLPGLLLSASVVLSGTYSSGCSSKRRSDRVSLSRRQYTAETPNGTRPAVIAESSRSQSTPETVR